MGSSNFNLKQLIDDYIDRIRVQGSITGSDAEELTNHLYDSTEAISKQGLSEEEAFIVACKRLGTATTLTEEYSKVNTSVKTNKVWAYLFLGFNFLYALPALFFTGVAILYFLVYKNFNTSLISTIIITSFHLLFSAFVWYIVSNKRNISNFIEKQIELNGIRFVCISFIPLLINVIPLVRFFTKIETAQLLTYPVYRFGSSFSEFSLYVALISIAAAVISLIFSINKLENLTLKTLFQRPSIGFLLLFGIILELFAASTRAIRMESIVGHALIFSSVYMAASFLIAFYNKANTINKYLLIALSLGLLLELTAGFIADRDRGDTFYTIYFVSGMLLGVILGRHLGIKFQNRDLQVSS
jgi:hypothetical protein